MPEHILTPSNTTILPENQTIFILGEGGTTVRLYLMERANTQTLSCHYHWDISFLLGVVSGQSAV